MWWLQWFDFLTMVTFFHGGRGVAGHGGSVVFYVWCLFFNCGDFSLTVMILGGRRR